MTTTTYTEVATATGAWCCRVLLPETPFETVCTLLKNLTTVTGTSTTTAAPRAPHHRAPAYVLHPSASSPRRPASANEPPMTATA